jgi:hypothetical protein
MRQAAPKRKGCLWRGERLCGLPRDAGQGKARPRGHRHHAGPRSITRCRWLRWSPERICILEKPFTITLAEADDILRLAKQKSVASPSLMSRAWLRGVLRLEKALREGLIGDLLEIHTVGKMGDRAGGQDMMVLGLHVFDLARLFGGEVKWCQASIRHQGKSATLPMPRNHPPTKSGPLSATTSLRISRWNRA